MKVLHRDQLRDGKAVVNLHHADFFLGIGDAGFLVCLLAAFAGGDEMVPVPIVVSHLLAGAQRQLQRLDADKILSAQLSGFFRCRHDGAGRTVTDPAAVEQSQRVGDDRSRHNLFFGHGLTQMGFGIQCAVGMAFGRYMRHGPL